MHQSWTICNSLVQKGTTEIPLIGCKVSYAAAPVNVGALIVEIHRNRFPIGAFRTGNNVLETHMNFCRRQSETLFLPYKPLQVVDLVRVYLLQYVSRTVSQCYTAFILGLSLEKIHARALKANG